MRNRFFRMIAASFLAATIAIGFTACGDDDDDDSTTPSVITQAEDGMYISGSATGSTDLSSSYMMKAGAMAETADGKAARTTLYSGYYALKAGSLSIVKVMGTEQTTFGGKNMADSSASGKGSKNYSQIGTLAQDADALTIPKDGLYFICFDTELNVVAVNDATFQIIGGFDSWSGTDLALSSFDLSKVTISKTDVKVTKGELKVRIPGAWGVLLQGDPSIKAVADLGGAIDKLVEGGDNIAIAASAYYTVSINWALGSGVTATLTKTKDVEAIDITQIKACLGGNDKEVFGGTAWSFDVTLNTTAKLPTTSENNVNIYNFTDVSISADDLFKVYINGSYLGYDKYDKFGTAESLLVAENGDKNFNFKEGLYDVTLTVTFSAAGDIESTVISVALSQFE